jgi:hypothetical protein
MVVCSSDCEFDHTKPTKWCGLECDTQKAIGTSYHSPGCGGLARCSSAGAFLAAAIMSADGMVRPYSRPANDGDGRPALHRKFAANVADGSFTTEASGLQRIPMPAMPPIDGVIGRPACG